MAALMLLRSVTAGSVTTNCARTGQAASAISATPTSTARLNRHMTIPPCSPRPRLRLPPRLEGVASPGGERLIGGASIPPGRELHVQRRGLGVTLAFGAREELL